MRKFGSAAVAATFAAYPTAVRRKLLALRELVFEVAATSEGVGRLQETVKWGQPSYLTPQTGSGTTVRLDRLEGSDGYAVYFHCQSGLIETFREIYPDTFTFEGKRALVFGAGERIPVRALRHCVGLALTHHHFLPPFAKRGEVSASDADGVMSSRRAASRPLRRPTRPTPPHFVGRKSIR